MAMLVECVEAGITRQHETLVLEHFLDQLRLITVFFFIVVVVILPDIANVLKEQHGEDEIFVGIRTDGAAKNVTGCPQRLVDIVLVYFVVHGSSLYKVLVNALQHLLSVGLQALDQFILFIPH
ncbi:hypothetical protein D3C80_1640340 [compost metagenome]